MCDFDTFSCYTSCSAHTLCILMVFLYLKGDCVILYRWYCFICEYEQLYALVLELEVLWYNVWKYWSHLSKYFWVCLMASLWMKNYSLIEYKIDIVDFCWYGVEVPPPNRKIISYCFILFKQLFSFSSEWQWSFIDIVA